MRPRALLLGAGSAAGVLTGRALDGLGLLPGVQESQQVRRIALAPSWTVAGLVACLLLGLLVDRLLERGRGLAVVLLVGGQVAAHRHDRAAGPATGHAAPTRLAPARPRSRSPTGFAVRRGPGAPPGAWQGRARTFSGGHPSATYPEEKTWTHIEFGVG